MHVYFQGYWLVKTVITWMSPYENIKSTHLYISYFPDYKVWFLWPLASTAVYSYSWWIKRKPTGCYTIGIIYFPGMVYIWRTFRMKCHYTTTDTTKFLWLITFMLWGTISILKEVVSSKMVMPRSTGYDGSLNGLMRMQLCKSYALAFIVTRPQTYWASTGDYGPMR